MLPCHDDARRIAAQVQEISTTRVHPRWMLWRAAAFRASEGQPMTQRRALALNAVLAQCALVSIPGDLLLGAKFGKWDAEPLDAAEVADAQAVLDGIGERDFWQGRDHHAPDYPTALRVGLGGLRARAEASLAAQTEAGPREFLLSVLEALDGASRFVARWAAEAERLAGTDTAYRALYAAQAAMLRHLVSAPPRTLWEALELVLLLHTCLQLDDRYAQALGRFDQYLYPFYQADLDAGRLTAEEAQRLFDHYFAKIATRDEVQNHTIGGVTPDGRDGTNPVSFLVLRAVQTIGRVGGNVTARMHAGTPDDFVRQCVAVIRTGIGYPAVYNDEVQIPALTAQGFPLEDARDYCFVGCIEVSFAGRNAPWGDGRFNLPRCVNLALYRGLDPQTGRQVGPDTGEPRTWDECFTAFTAQMRHQLRQHVDAVNAHKAAVDARAADFTAPLMSALTADCLARGRDLNDGGARYPSNYGFACIGIGSTADALMAVKRLVYDEGRFTLDALRRMLDADFVGYAAEQRLLLDAPKYGNDEPEVDALAIAASRAFGEACLTHRTPGGGRYWSLLAANTSNIWAGCETSATPDGRRAGEPLSDAASPTFGRDRNGPTAVVNSIAKLDYRLHPGGNVINMKFHPSALAGDAGLDGLAALIRAGFAMGNVQLQFNTTDREVLQDAMAHPDRHRDLVVRVSGFSGYFVELDHHVQQDILSRTEHGRV